MSTSNATRKQRVKRGLGLYASEGRNRNSGSNAGMTMIERNRRTAKAQKNAAKAAAATEKAAAKAHAAALKEEAAAAKAAEKAAKEAAKAVEKAEKEAVKTEKALAAAAKKTVASEVRLATAASEVRLATAAAVPCVGITCHNSGKYKVAGSNVYRYLPEQCTRVCPPGATTPFCKICQKQSNAGTLHGRANVVHPSGAVVLRSNSHIRDPLANLTEYSAWNMGNMKKADARAAKAAAPKTAKAAKKGTNARATNTPAAAGGPAGPAPGVPNFNFE